MVWCGVWCGVVCGVVRCALFGLDPYTLSVTLVITCRHFFDLSVWNVVLLDQRGFLHIWIVTLAITCRRFFDLSVWNVVLLDQRGLHILIVTLAITCRRFFDLSVWNVVLLDQRGCGASTPRGCLVSANELVGECE